MNTLYNLSYIDHLLKKDSATAQEINKIRWEWVKDVVMDYSEYETPHVLDFGSGVGWFRAFRPDGIEVDTYDINTHSPQTGIIRRKYDLITFWDVLEHIKDLIDLQPLFRMTRYIAMSVPLLPDGKELKLWKHYRPGEHLRYFSLKDWDKLFAGYGLKRCGVGYPECPPREDIVSMIFSR